MEREYNRRRENIYNSVRRRHGIIGGKNKEEMRSMIERLEGYLEKKGLELNTEKTKIMRFRKGGGRLGKNYWRWKGKIEEKIQEFKYLGYVMQRNGGQKAQVRDRMRKAAVAM